MFINTRKSAIIFGTICFVLFGFVTGACEVKLNCGDTNIVDDANLERRIADWLADKHDVEATVACPKDRPAKPGDTFTCEATTGDGTVLVFDVVQKNDQGSVKFETSGLLIDTRKDLAAIKAKLPASAVITCPQRVLYLKQVGNTASCDLRDGDERAQLVIRYENAEDGRYTMAVAAATP